MSKKIQRLLLFQLFQLSSYILFHFPYFHSLQGFWLLVKSNFFKNKIIRQNVEEKFSQVFQQIIQISNHLQADIADK